MSAQVLSALLPHHGFCLCCKQLALYLQVLFNVVSGGFVFFYKLFFFGLNWCLLYDCRFRCRIEYFPWAASNFHYSCMRCSMYFQGT